MMADLISRKAAINAIGEKPLAWEKGEYEQGLQNQWERDVDAIKTLQPAEPEQRWIPCAERLPEEGHDVLITKESFKIKGYEQKVVKAKRSADPRSGKIEWWSPEFGTLTNEAVLAWMPLPDPYTEEGGE